MQIQTPVEILVIDDMNEIIDVLDFSLTKGFNATVHKATNVVDSLEIMKNNPNIVVVVIDLHLHEDSQFEHGLSLCEVIRAASPCKIILVMTGYASLENLRDSRFAGADDYIMKPFKVKTLVKIVNENLAKIKRWEKGLNRKLIHCELQYKKTKEKKK